MPDMRTNDITVNVELDDTTPKPIHRGAITAAIISVLWLPGWYLFAPIGMIAGYRAIKEIRRVKGRGEGLAIGAFVLSCLGLAVWLMHLM